MRIELIPTDSKVQKRIVWVHSTSNGVYCGSCIEGRDTHVSYHADGNIFNNFEGRIRKAYTTKPLNQLKGFHQLLASGGNSDISNMLHPPYALKKLDAIVSIDVRNYKKMFGCLVFLVEANNVDAVAQIIKSFQNSRNPPELTEVHSFLQCNPWLVIVMYSGVST
jgi:hypothetical protein